MIAVFGIAFVLCLGWSSLRAAALANDARIDLGIAERKLAELKATKERAWISHVDWAATQPPEEVIAKMRRIRGLMVEQGMLPPLPPPNAG
jgi:hypothetical protein